VTQPDENEAANEEEEFDLLPHPDPNEEDHEGMIYVGRLDRDGRRYTAHVDYTIRYIFGTSFDDESHQHIDRTLLIHQDPKNITTAADTVESSATAKKQRPLSHSVLHPKHKNRTQPIPYGHVETHERDGGIFPVQAVAVEPFWLDQTPVTNKEFAKFVKATLYETEAEKFGWSFVLSSFVEENSSYEQDPEAEHWVAVPGAYWRQPEGPKSSYKHREHHPVVHVSHRDAAEYCAWKHKRLPGEREYEAAARASQWDHHYDHDRAINHSINNDTNFVPIANRTIYAWGDEASWEVAKQYSNLWGSDAHTFPYTNFALDGWRGTSPVTHYPPNSMGFYDLTGNVWEWMRGGKNKARILRGASYVDSLDGSFNVAATLGARATAHGTTTAGNIGFRCAKSIRKKPIHHWSEHDEHEGQESMVLGIEDAESGKKQTIATTTTAGSSMESFDEEMDDDEVERPKKKKKKIALKRELRSDEL
jgi:formylglycine-generating enzyme required for sulfatase activity